MNDRAQSTIDFVFAVLIFLSIVTGVILYTANLPETSTEQDISRQEEVSQAADLLSTNHLSTTDEHGYRLDRECARLFFDKYRDGSIDGDATLQEDCKATPLDRSSIQQAIGVQETRNINITIYEFSSGDVSVVDGTTMTAGSTSTIENDAFSSTRIVIIDDRKYILKVELW